MTSDEVNNPDVTVEGKFTPEGVSVSVYDESACLIDETWFTWAEIEELKGNQEIDFAFEVDL